MRSKLLQQTDHLLAALIDTIGASPLRDLANRAGDLASRESLVVAGSLLILRACLLQLTHRLDGPATEDDWLLAREEIVALVAFVRDPSPLSLENLGSVWKRKKPAPGSNSLN